MADRIWGFRVSDRPEYGTIELREQQEIRVF